MVLQSHFICISNFTIITWISISSRWNVYNLMFILFQMITNSFVFSAEKNYSSLTLRVFSNTLEWFKAQVLILLWLLRNVSTSKLVIAGVSILFSKLQCDFITSGKTITINGFTENRLFEWTPPRLRYQY